MERELAIINSLAALSVCVVELARDTKGAAAINPTMDALAATLDNLAAYADDESALRELNDELSARTEALLDRVSR